MNFENFYKKYICRHEKDKTKFDIFYDSLCKVFGKESPQFQKESDIILALRGNSLTLTMTQFYTMKVYLVEFYEWLFEESLIEQSTLEHVKNIKLLDAVSKSTVSQCYFQDLDGVLNFVDLVGSANGLTDDSDMLLYKTIFTLSWYGVELSEMPEIKKTDLNDSSSSVSINGKEITINKHYDLLTYFSAIDAIRGFPTGKMQYLKDSDYLLRSSRSFKMTTNGICQNVAKFNVEAKKYGKEIKITELKRNGLFDKVYNDRRGLSPTELIMEFTGTTRQFASWERKEYETWKSEVKGDEAEWY